MHIVGFFGKCELQFQSEINNTVNALSKWKMWKQKPCFFSFLEEFSVKKMDFEEKLCVNKDLTKKIVYGEKHLSMKMEKLG